MRGLKTRERKRIRDEKEGRKEKERCEGREGDIKTQRHCYWRTLTGQYGVMGMNSLCLWGRPCSTLKPEETVKVTPNPQLICAAH